jgi:hypothetical protein
MHILSFPQKPAVWFSSGKTPLNAARNDVEDLRRWCGHAESPGKQYQARTCSIFRSRSLLPTPLPRYIPRMAKLSPIESEFDSTEAADAYDAWFRAKIEPRMTSKTPGIPQDEAMARMQAILDRRKAR